MLSDRPAESVTVSLKLIVVSACKFDGAVKLDVAWLALLSWTVGPLICVHANVIGLPSGSWLALPSSVKIELSLTVWSGPTTAIGAVSVGGRGGGGGVAVCLTKIETVSKLDKPLLSATVSLKLIVVSACKFDGAVKLDVAWLALLSWTGGPLICVHANVIGLPSGSWLALPSSVTSEPSLTVLSAE